MWKLTINQKRKDCESLTEKLVFFTNNLAQILRSVEEFASLKSETDTSYTIVFEPKTTEEQNEID